MTYPFIEKQPLTQIASVIDSLQRAKQQFLADQNFDKAIEVRNEIMQLKEKLFEILKSENYKIEVSGENEVKFINIVNSKKKPVYLTEYHRKNSEAAMKSIADSKKLQIDWDAELERLKRNSKDQHMEKKPTYLNEAHRKNSEGRN